MTIEWTSLPLGFIAGVLSLLSPCVLPMIPAVAASAGQASRQGLWFLATGLAVSFALGGTFLTYLLLNLQIDREVLRQGSAIVLAALATVLAVPALNERVSFRISLLVNRMPGVEAAGRFQGKGSSMQLLVGVCLGLVWLPCVGPTLGSAIALASMGHDMGMAFLVMLSFGLGTAAPLMGLGHITGRNMKRLMQTGTRGRVILGATLALLAVVVSSGLDRILEEWSLAVLPDWVTQI